MPRHQARQIPEALIEVQQRLEQWRGTQAPRAKLPEAIWQSAADVAKQYGVYATAKALRLDYAALKKRTLGPATLRRKSAHVKPAQAAFLELIARPVAKAEDYVVEFESTHGAKMRVQWKASAPPDWSTLLRAWSETEK
jgi:tRNA U34 5-methylaminomethyl-2-thiouridine-forming methyltransferase MnmC